MKKPIDNLPNGAGPNDGNASDDERFAKQAKSLFDSSVERLDAAALSRLNQARNKALESATNNRRGVHWLRWMPATGVAAAALVTVMVMRGPNGVDPSPLTASDFEMLLEEESLELLEDLEFYSWLEVAELDVNDNVG